MSMTVYVRPKHISRADWRGIEPAMKKMVHDFFTEAMRRCHNPDPDQIEDLILRNLPAAKELNRRCKTCNRIFEIYLTDPELS